MPLGQRTRADHLAGAGLPNGGAPDGHAGSWDGFQWRGLVAVGLFWTLFGAIISTSLLLSGTTRGVSRLALLAFAFGGAYTWAALSPPLFRLAAWLHPSRLESNVGLGVLVAAGIAIAMGVSVALSGITYVASDGLRSVGFLTMLRFRFPTDLLATLLVFSAGIARGYFVHLQARQQEAADLRTRLVEARLEVLRTQLNPHFLFNTLNAIAALATTDPQRVRSMLAQLSEVLRYMLDGSSEQEITLDREVGILRKYLDILETRYEGWLRTSIHVDDDARDALVPNLILQPLAENALKHGISPAGGAGRIDIRGHRDGDHLVLTVWDSGSNSGSVATLVGASSSSRGFGLRHTRERLEQLYGERQRFTLTRTGDGGTIAEVRLPYRLGVAAAGPGARAMESSPHG